MGKKQELIDECYLNLDFGSEMNPLRVIRMVEEAFRAGYEQAIRNYVEPHKPQVDIDLVKECVKDALNYIQKKYGEV